MKLRRLALAAFSLTLATPVLAADCRPDPLPGRVVYLRGSFNDWRADDEMALRYVCDHYELVARLSGAQSFKFGDDGLVAGSTSARPPMARSRPAPPSRSPPRARR